MNQGQTKSVSDQELIDLIRSGNRMAFNLLYDKFWEELFYYAFNVLNDRSLAEDVLHDVFTNLWVKRESLEISSLKSYLLVAVRNKSISQLSKVTFTAIDEVIIDGLSSAPDGENQLNEEDLRAVIESAAASLPERCKEIFLMSRFKELSNSEIAEYYNISVRTVENQISLALKHIRRSVRDVGFIVLFL